MGCVIKWFWLRYLSKGLGWGGGVELLRFLDVRFYSGYWRFWVWFLMWVDLCFKRLFEVNGE